MIDNKIRQKLENLVVNKIPEILEVNKKITETTANIEDTLQFLITEEQWNFKNDFPDSVWTFNCITLGNRWESPLFKSTRCSVYKPKNSIYNTTIKFELSKEFPNIFVEENEEFYRKCTITVDNLLKFKDDTGKISKILDQIEEIVRLKNKYMQKLDAFIEIIKDPKFTLTKLKQNYIELYNLYKEREERL